MRPPRSLWRAFLHLFLYCLCIELWAHPALAQQPATPSARDLYTKSEVYIPMRDGVRLYTVVFVPKDSSKPYPLLLTRTPYGVPYGADNYPREIGPSARFTADGYIVAYQDVRGTHMSEGDFVNVRPELKERHKATDIDESTDAYDTIDWLVRCIPNNNGRAGMWGVSYGGFYTDAGAINAHPALKAVSPQAPLTDWFLGDDDNHNGAFYLIDNFAWDFDSSFDYPRPGPARGYPAPEHSYGTNDAYQFYLDLGPLKNADTRYFHNAVPYWDELLTHDTYDSYWQDRSLLPHLTNIRPAMLTVGGWFDAEDYFGTWATFRSVARQSPATENYVVIGPWPHGGWSRGAGDQFGGLQFDSATGPYFRDQIEFPFFEYYLKGIGARPAAKAQVFLTGSNQWRSFDAWPPPAAKERSLYLQASKALSFDSPTKGSDASADADSYVSDPANPVPYSAHAHTEIGRYTPYVVEDQRFLASRPDVLTYRTEPLTDDVTVAGPVRADLFVSLSGTDVDFIVKVIDVYPDDPAGGNGLVPTPAPGSEILIRAQVMRGKFRDSFSNPSPFRPGVVTPVSFDLLDTGHTFRKGHRIEVQIQSSWFPIVDRNPQKFMDIPKAGADDFQKETIQVYRSDRYPSHIVFSTL